MGRGWRRHEWSQPVDMKRQTNTAGVGIFGCQFRLAQAAGVSSPIQSTPTTRTTHRCPSVKTNKKHN